MDELLDFDALPDTGALNDPGIHPRYQLFCANVLFEYLEVVPGRINCLMSEVHITEGAKSEYARFARTLYLDSGAITWLLRVLRGRATREDVQEWLTHDMGAAAWRIHEAGAPAGVVASMDLPAYSDMLAASGFSVKDAADISLTNALTLAESTLPPGWRPVYGLQGTSIEDYRKAAIAFDRAGLLDEVRKGRAWLAGGGLAFEPSETRVMGVFWAIREVLGPEGHIHALGVNRLGTLAPLMAHGIVNSADSSSPAQEVRYNRGVYRTDGPRPTFLWKALHAASALYYEAQLAAALNRISNQPLVIQEELFA